MLSVVSWAHVSPHGIGKSVKFGEKRDQDHLLCIEGPHPLFCDVVVGAMPGIWAVDAMRLTTQIVLAEYNLAFGELLEHDVTMHRASYEMPFLGNDITVSGAMFVPDAPETIAIHLRSKTT